MLHELEERLRVKKVSGIVDSTKWRTYIVPLHQEQEEALEDATMALYEAEDEEVPILIGEGMMILPKDEAIEKVEQMTEELNTECADIESQINDIKKELAELKVILYGKFKNSINLED